MKVQVKKQNAKSHDCVISATRVALVVNPTISNESLSEVIRNEFNELNSDEVVRSIHMAIWWFNKNHSNLKRNYKNL